MTPIGLYWWRHQDQRIRNVGDELSPLIVAMVSGRPVTYAPMATCDLVATGSQAEVALEIRRDRPIHVWGTGFQFEGPPVEPTHARVAAVRGPLSAARLGLAGMVAMGDPGLLADGLLDRMPRVRHRVGLVPHYVDLDLPAVRAWNGLRHDVVISPLTPPRVFIRAIAACDVILSSSLHGLAVADALGVPNRWVRLSDRVRGDGYKFRDHLQCVGEKDDSPIELPALGALDAPALETIGNAYRRAGLEEIRRRLVASFPRM